MYCIGKGGVPSVMVTVAGNCHGAPSSKPVCISHSANTLKKKNYESHCYPSNFG